ncbi:4-hydroxy-tetrahydrodipicolinate reductase [Candidatus Kuenenbacteria bacterium HGW-Kuenenbacteria-1]|uniref:4-hydroxy-tetrahydrodipicolinate reductase n=1 Tax=Candidatus Kuenenbacteria bacterium HGW-Kuenenbacteria-1 TaxID=2013812 RepID=A0A2N1UMX9_9BACT|nr:MAG: 4-hydroxy-tetrahydrodipicolinate reductase [Candidatus Kuenenbacteria bacterium HGW-Kuenenbacteria-1]
MNIAIIGFGAMGKIIKELAELAGHNVLVIVDPQTSVKKIDEADFSKIDVAIDFSHPTSAIENIKKLSKLKVNTVVGTTGWYNQMDDVKKIVEESKIGLLWSSNFSIGVNLYYEIIKKASQLFNNFPEFDIWAHEVHHYNKADSPSGTAKIIEKILLENIKRKTSVVEEKLDRKIKPEEIHFSSTRGGAVNFTHDVCFDSASDYVMITHIARDRKGYAEGAIKAAEWLNKKQGFFSMEDFLENIK